MRNFLEQIANGETGTAQLGTLLAGVLQAGDVVALHGDLGAGKTSLVRTIVAALGGDTNDVNSPTFVIVQQYPARLPVFHIDAYRLADVEEFLELGGDEILAGEGVCLIEWAARIEDILPADCLQITIEATGPQTRRFTLRANGERSAQMIAELAGK